MSTLFKRSGRRERMLLRMVAGAVRDAAQAHEGEPVTETFARSVAKRAVGTISAAWPELLAAETKVGPSVTQTAR